MNGHIQLVTNIYLTGKESQKEKKRAVEDAKISQAFRAHLINKWNKNAERLKHQAQQK